MKTVRNSECGIRSAVKPNGARSLFRTSHSALRTLLLLLCSALTTSAQFTFHDLPFLASGSLGSGLWQGITYPPPTIWVDVVDYLGTPDMTNLRDITNRGTAGGYFFTNADASPKLFRTSGGGAFSGQSGSAAGAVWATPAGGTNTHQYFTQDSGTIAMRVWYPNAPTQSGGGPIQTGTSPPTGNYAYIQFTGGTAYFDWGNGSSYRISRAIPPNTTAVWFNAIYTKSGTNQTMWFFGTNYVMGARTDKVTNSVAGPLAFFQGLNDTNYLTKRILLFQQGLTTNEVALLDEWMTAQP